MQLTTETLAQIARLARLSLTPSEAEQYGRQLTEIVDAMAALNAIPTDGVPPADQPSVVLAETRDDLAQTRHHSPGIVDLAPDHTGRFVRLKGGLFSS